MRKREVTSLKEGRAGLPVLRGRDAEIFWWDGVVKNVLRGAVLCGVIVFLRVVLAEGLAVRAVLAVLEFELSLCDHSIHVSRAVRLCM